MEKFSTNYKLIGYKTNSFKKIKEERWPVRTPGVRRPCGGKDCSDLIFLCFVSFHQGKEMKDIRCRGFSAHPFLRIFDEIDA